MMNSLRAPGTDSSHVLRRHGRGSQPRPYRISQSFYENTCEPNEQGNTQDPEPNQSTFPTMVHQSYDIKRYETRQSRRLPQWVWYLLVRFLGIKLNPTDRPIFGTIMHILTLAFSLAYIITFAWYIAYDIKNEYTKQTVLTGLISIVMVVFWSSLGIYAHKLAARLFSSQKFVDSVRLHTRTVFKVSAAGLMIIIATASTVLNNYTAATVYTGESCQNLTVSPVVCYVMFGARLGYSIFSLIWNLLVGIVLLSVCRTHTIGIRRFIRQLEDDGHVYELFVRNMYMNQGVGAVSPQSDVTELPDDEQYEWDDEISPTADEYYAIPSPRVTPTHTPTQPRFPGGFGTVETNPPRRTTIDITAPDVLATGDQDNNCDIRSGSLLTQAEILVDVGDSQNAPAEGSSTANQSVPSTETVTIETTGATPTTTSPIHHKHPIIIVKEGSIPTTDDADLELTNVASNTAVDSLRVDCMSPVEGAENSSETEGVVQDKVRFIHPDPPSFASRSTQHSMMVELNSPRRVLSTPSIETGRSSSVDQTSLGPSMLSPDNILLCYWRIGCRLRSTSIALQRWLVAWVCFILAWSLSFIIAWVKHEATLVEIAAFILPIFLLPLVCSAYGEVNMEGKRMIQSVCPTEERVQMLLFIENQPLQIMVFGFPINYSTVVKVVGALAVAFGTKIILEEFSVFT